MKANTVEDHEDIIKILLNGILDCALMGRFEECMKRVRHIRIMALEDSIRYADKIGVTKGKEQLKVELKRLKNE